MQKGSKVRFGRPHGKKSVGVVLRVNRKTVQVQVTEPDGGYPVGTRVRVDKLLCADLREKVELPREKRSPKPGVSLGTQFRSVMADCNALWEVKRKRGRDTYECEVVNEPIEYEGRKFDSDFAGHRRVFGGEEIRQKLALAAMFDRSKDANKAFYASLEVGSTVHYHNAFGQYVRCEVVVAPSDDACVHAKAGDKCLKGVALVGNWKDWDLKPDSYHVRSIREEKLFQPHCSCVFEHAGKSHPNHPDPTGLEPIEIKGQIDLFCA